MKRRLFSLLALSGAITAMLLAAVGCNKKPTSALFPNQAPVLSLTNAPVDTSDVVFYAYRVNWSAYDPDGRVEYYRYAVDPPPARANAETTWVQTTNNEEVLFFPSTQPTSSDPTAGRLTAEDFHTFIIRAYDNRGGVSPLLQREFFSFTVAPEVQIESPRPQELLPAQITPATTISWSGKDVDGQLTQKPVRYKYIMLSQGGEFPVDLARSQPDSLRRYYAKRNWAGWTTVGADTLTATFTDLLPNQQYVFAVIAFDEAGAYSPGFSLLKNMLWMNCGFAATLGPQFTAFSEFFNYTWPGGGYTTDPAWSFRLEVPAGQVLTFNWFAAPPLGSAIRHYRWVLDLANLDDNTPRSDERTDWYHWSVRSNLLTSCTIGPFEASPVPHILYLEAEDNNGLRSLAPIELTVVRPTLDRSLLIVDDTRREPDKFISPGVLQSPPYGSAWPSSSELDTFLVAKGGGQWASAPPGTVTPPGIFTGYDFDTLGTRTGLEIPSLAAPLSKLGRYRHIIWMIDGLGALNTETGAGSQKPYTSLRYMSERGRASTLATYTRLGGKVWLLGGGAAYATTFPWRRLNAPTVLFGADYQARRNDLGPGRYMFDVAHWNTEAVSATWPTRLIRMRHITNPQACVDDQSPCLAPGLAYYRWPGVPDYSQLPAELRRKTPATDPLPWTRVGQTAAFYQNNFDIEYISDNTFVIEDVDPDPVVVNERSVLDTLMEFNTGFLKKNDLVHSVAASMTYYHGSQGAPNLFSGFNIWNFAREDCMQLVDFVLQRIWGLPRANVSRSITAPIGARPAPATVSTPAQRPSGTGLPIGRRNSQQ